MADENEKPWALEPQMGAPRYVVGIDPGVAAVTAITVLEMEGPGQFRVLNCRCYADPKWPFFTTRWRGSRFLDNRLACRRWYGMTGEERKTHREARLVEDHFFPRR